MKKNLLFLITLLAMGISFMACNEDDSKIDYREYYEWRDKNNAINRRLMQYRKTLGSSAYFADTVPCLSEPYSYPVSYRVIASANEDSLRAINKWYTPYFTSTLKVHYTLYDPESVMEKLPATDAEFNDPAVMDKIFFESDNKADTLESKQVEFFENFTAGSVVTGWGDALQQMHIGDNWLISIPWFIAYGQAGQGNIEPYSNLFFRIKLVDITELGQTIPASE